jgi:PAP_fibrillin
MRGATTAPCTLAMACPPVVDLVHHFVVDMSGTVYTLQGWVETTYVDDSFRIGHGDKGSVFITSKAARQAQ